MLRIPCPHCGMRDEAEFKLGGESHVTRPNSDVSDQEWADYLFNRLNSKGVQYERWCHSYGCGEWFNLVRNTVTHEISVVYRVGDAPPALESEASKTGNWRCD